MEDLLFNSIKSGERFYPQGSHQPGAWTDFSGGHQTMAGALAAIETRRRLDQVASANPESGSPPFRQYRIWHTAIFVYDVQVGAVPPAPPKTPAEISRAIAELTERRSSPHMEGTPYGDEFYGRMAHYATALKWVLGKVKELL